MDALADAILRFNPRIDEFSIPPLFLNTSFDYLN